MSPQSDVGGDRCEWCEWCVHVRGVVTPSCIPAQLSSQTSQTASVKSANITSCHHTEKLEQQRDLHRTHMVSNYQDWIKLGFVLDCNSWSLSIADMGGREEVVVSRLRSTTVQFPSTKLSRFRLYLTQSPARRKRVKPSSHEKKARYVWWEGVGVGAGSAGSEWCVCLKWSRVDGTFWERQKIFWQWWNKFLNHLLFVFHLLITCFVCLKSN